MHPMFRWPARALGAALVALAVSACNLLPEVRDETTGEITFDTTVVVRSGALVNLRRVVLQPRGGS